MIYNLGQEFHLLLIVFASIEYTSRFFYTPVDSYCTGKEGEIQYIRQIFLLHRLEMVLRRMEMTLRHMEIVLRVVEMALRHVEMTLRRMEIVLRHKEMTLRHMEIVLRHVEMTLRRMEITLRGLQEMEHKYRSKKIKGGLICF